MPRDQESAINGPSVGAKILAWGTFQKEWHHPELSHSRDCQSGQIDGDYLAF